MSVAQTHNLRTTEHQIHMDIHEVSPASASGRIMSVAQTHNLRRQYHINEHKAPCKSAQDAQGKPLSINEKIPMRARTVSRQPRGLPSSEGGIQTAQSHHHGPTNRQYTPYGAGHRERGITMYQANCSLCLTLCHHGTKMFLRMRMKFGTVGRERATVQVPILTLKCGIMLRSDGTVWKW